MQCITPIYAPELFPRKRPKIYRNIEREQYLLENPTIDPAILALALRVSERFVIQYQRKLGIRPLTSGNPYGKPNLLGRVYGPGY